MGALFGDCLRGWDTCVPPAQTSRDSQLSLSVASCLKLRLSFPSFLSGCHKDLSIGGDHCGAGSHKYLERAGLAKLVLVFLDPYQCSRFILCNILISVMLIICWVVALRPKKLHSVLRNPVRQIVKGSKRAKRVNNKDLQLSQALCVTLLSICLGIWQTDLQTIFAEKVAKGKTCSACTDLSSRCLGKESRDAGSQFPLEGKEQNDAGEGPEGGFSFLHLGDSWKAGTGFWLGMSWVLLRWPQPG